MVALLLKDGGDIGIAAGDLDHARHFGDRALTFDFSIAPCTTRVFGGRGTDIDAGGASEGRAAVLLQLLRLVEADDLQLCRAGV